MSEIAELLESALRSNQHVLRQAAMRTVSRMPSTTTIRELLSHEAAAAIRELTLDDLAVMLAEQRATPPGSSVRSGARRISAETARAAAPSTGTRTEATTAGADAGTDTGTSTGTGAGADRAASGSREAQIYRAIVEALSGEPKTIGQLATAVTMDTDELRGYLDWMKRSGRVVSHGRARATRYTLA
jgi:hypothetical protein